MKIHLNVPLERWDDKTRCGQLIYRASADTSRIYIPKENLRPNKRGVTCLRCSPAAARSPEGGSE